MYLLDNHDFQEGYWSRATQPIDPLEYVNS